MKRLVFMTMLLFATMICPAHLLAEKAGSGQGMKIWFDTGGAAGGPYNTIVQNGAQAAANDMDVEIRFMYSDWSPEKMISNFKLAMADNPDGIVVYGIPGDDSFSPFIDEAFKDGIVVTSIDTKLPQNQDKHRTRGFGFVGTDNYLQGKALAEEALKRSNLQAGDRAFVWGLKRLQERGRRAQAILEVLESAGIIVDYFEISPEIDKDSAMGTPPITGYLSRNPDCKLMIVDHGALTSQMENFLRAAGISPGEIFVSGYS